MLISNIEITVIRLKTALVVDKYSFGCNVI